jgi:serralysin
LWNSETLVFRFSIRAGDDARQRRLIGGSTKRRRPGPPGSAGLRFFLTASAASLLVLSAQAGSLSRKIDATGDARIDGVVSNVTWASSDFTFSFPKGSNELRTEQQRIVRETFAEISSFANVKFDETDGPAMLMFQRWDKASVLGRVNAEQPGKTFISPLDNQWNDLNMGSYARRYFRHEIGHILGLEHTHNNSAHRPEPIGLDNVSHSVMSYRLTENRIMNFPRKDVYPQSYMPLDILALQYLYGANFTTNAGDTTYKFTPADGLIFKTIWDGGGTDTLDFSAYGTDGTFDMRPGRLSTPSEAQRVEFEPGEKAEGSIAMPYLPKGDPRALIENIVVGDGNNTIALNYADNRVALGSGHNRIVEYPGTGKDVIENFGDDDMLDLCGYHVPGKMVHVKADGADTVITVDQWPNDEIRLKGMTTGNPQLRIDCGKPVASSVRAGVAKSDLVSAMARPGSSSAGEISAKVEKLWKSEDYEKAVALAGMAYEKTGDSNAAYRLGTAYYGGYGVKKNLETAWRYLSIPALDNIRYALYYRGLILADPAYSGHDIAAARVVLQKAGDMGVPEAAKALANLPAG